MQSLLRHYPSLTLCHLGIGEGGVYDKPAIVQTVLGSCVAVTLHSPSLGIGAIFHALLPRRAEYERSALPLNPYKFVDSAIEALLRSLRKRGARERELECKLFGGANSIMAEKLNIGLKNVEMAMEVLSRHGIFPMASDVGGPKGRKLLFVTATGEVYVKRLS